MEGKERHVFTYYFPLVYTYFPLYIFLPRLGLLYPSRRPHLSGQKVWRKGEGDWFRQYFPPKSYNFLHHQFSIPTFCTHILLTFSTHILMFVHTLTHNSRHFFFWRIIIDIIVFERKKKTCIIFRRKINGIVAWWFWKDINWHNCFMEEKKMCITFGNKINKIIAWWKKN